jgi:hypothetical protein
LNKLVIIITKDIPENIAKIIDIFI